MGLCSIESQTGLNCLKQLNCFGKYKSLKHACDVIVRLCPSWLTNFTLIEHPPSIQDDPVANWRRSASVSFVAPDTYRL